MNRSTLCLRRRFCKGDRSLIIHLHTDRIKVIGKSERLLAAGEAERYTYLKPPTLRRSEDLVCRKLYLGIPVAFRGKSSEAVVSRHASAETLS